MNAIKHPVLLLALSAAIAMIFYFFGFAVASFVEWGFPAGWMEFDKDWRKGFAVGTALCFLIAFPLYLTILMRFEKS